MASIRRRGNSWQARVLRHGFPPEVRSFPSKAAARRWGVEVEAAIATGKHHSTSGANGILFGDVLDRYAREVSPSKRGGKDEVIRIKAIQRSKLADHAIINVSANVISRFRDDRLKRVGAGAVIRDLSLISSIINHARREWGVTVDNPCNLVRKPAAPSGRSRVLTEMEEARLLDALRPIGRRSPWTLPAVQLALATAMRRGELLALEWQHVDLASCTALLPLTKNGRARTVPLSSRALAVMQALPSPHKGRVLKIRAEALHAAFARARVRSGLRDLHFHDLRHTAATRMAARLPNVIELAAVTGHQTVQMLKRYYHPDAQALAKKLG